MREILFRAKRKHKANEWVQGFYKEEKDFDGVNHSYIGCYEIDKDTLGQFTGLTDRNGTKIFEGDIIVMDEYPFYDNGVLSYVGEVVWFENTFSFGLILNCVNKNKVGISNGVSENIEDDMVFEVIGNIHDNKDLIE